MESSRLPELFVPFVIHRVSDLFPCLDEVFRRVDEEELFFAASLTEGVQQLFHWFKLFHVLNVLWV